MANYCTKCGYKIQKGEKECRQCGSSVHDMSRYDSSRLYKFLTMFLTVVVVVLAILLIIKMNTKRTVETEEVKSEESTSASIVQTDLSKDMNQQSGILSIESKEEIVINDIDIKHRIPQKVGNCKLNVSHDIVTNKDGYEFDIRLGVYDCWVNGENKDLLSSMATELGISSVPTRGDQYGLSNNPNDSDMYFLLGFMWFANITDGFSLEDKPQQLEYMLRIDHDNSDKYYTDNSIKREINDIMASHKNSIAMKVFKNPDELLYATELLGGLNIGEVLCEKTLSSDDVYIPFILATYSPATPNNPEGDNWFLNTILDIQVSNPLNKNEWIVIAVKPSGVNHIAEDEVFSTSEQEDSTIDANKAFVKWVCSKERWSNGLNSYELTYTYKYGQLVETESKDSGGYDLIEYYSYEYDKDGLLIKKNIDSDGIKKWTDYKYDTKGNRIAETTYDEDGYIEKWESYEYDNLNRLVYKEFQIYDGIVYRYRYQYDSNSRVSREVNCDENGNSLGLREYEYDNKGNIVKCTIIDSNGQVQGWSYIEYDDNDNKIRETEYDGDGNACSWYEYEYKQES